MIKIRCTSLEDVRKNPAAYAQLLISDNAKISGGTHGMFAYWQDVAKLVHLQKLTPTEGIKELQQKFMRFDDTPRNKSKQDHLMEQFVKYCKQYDKNEFAFVDGKRQMKWELYAGVMLTGLTPLVVHNDDGYYSYLITEKPFEWKEQLRFPLMQQYLADYNIDCDVSEMHVGIYCLATGKFEFKIYSGIELSNTIITVSEIFKNVQHQLEKFKAKH
jgi:hypothetical protein